MAAALPWLHEMAAAAAKITEAATGDIFEFMGFLDSWVCKYRFSTLRRFDSSGQISKKSLHLFSKEKINPLLASAGRELIFRESAGSSILSHWIDFNWIFRFSITAAGGPWKVLSTRFFRSFTSVSRFG